MMDGSINFGLKKFHISDFMLFAFLLCLYVKHALPPNLFVAIAYKVSILVFLVHTISTFFTEVSSLLYLEK